MWKRNNSGYNSLFKMTPTLIQNSAGFMIYFVIVLFNQSDKLGVYISE